MFRRTQPKQRYDVLDPQEYSLQQLIGDAELPISLRAINNLHENAKRRFYRALIPPELLIRFDINPITWKGADREEHVRLIAEPGTNRVLISAWHSLSSPDPFFSLEVQDNAFNGIELIWVSLNNPHSLRFHTDVDETGHRTLLGMARRNEAEEERAMAAGLAPGQIRAGLCSSAAVFQQLDVFLTALSQQAYFLEPLTYASAWVFERRGCAYAGGHALMDSIHHEFQPGGLLHKALDGSTPFRQPAQWKTVRGRAWAIQDGILEALDATWNKIRMVKRIGCHAGVNSFPDAVY